MNRRKYILSLASILFVTLLLVSGSTFAYLSWVSSDNTMINVTMSEGVNMSISMSDEGQTGLRPTLDYTFTNGTVNKGQGVVYTQAEVYVENQTGVTVRPSFKLKIKITDKNGNVITNDMSYMDETDGDSSTNKPYMYYIKYVVTEEAGNGMILASGRFDGNEDGKYVETVSGSGWYDSKDITTRNSLGFPKLSGHQNEGISYEIEPYSLLNYHNYYVYFWIDGDYTTVNTGNTGGDLLQDATIAVSFSDNSTIEQVSSELVGDAYAVYDESGNGRLYFYRSETPITAGSSYNSHTVTQVFTGFEDAVYYSDTTKVPWNSVNFRYVKITADYIAPKTTSYWFANKESLSVVDLGKLDTSNVVTMDYMFKNSGTNSTDSVAVSIEGLGSFNTSKVVSMLGMFDGFASGAQLLYGIDGISKWNTSSLTTMNYMFRNMAPNANWSVDLSNWNVCKVTDYVGFNSGAISKITSPNFGMECPS